LVEALRGLESAVVACSGGADSTLLLKAVKISGIDALAVTSSSESLPPWDREDALRLARLIDVPHRMVEAREIDNPLYAANDGRRCFHCKDSLFGLLRAIAEGEGFRHVIDGSTVDDLRDLRPGLDAAKKHGVRSPLVEAGIGKRDVRELSRELGLPTWDKPSSPCLASRIPYGMRVTEEALRQVASAEAALRDLGFREFRVRHHGHVARLEASDADFALSVKMRDRVCETLKAAGFRFAAIDLEPFRSGNLNRLIDGA
jgi:uncharacterized protein